MTDRQRGACEATLCCSRYPTLSRQAETSVIGNAKAICTDLSPRAEGYATSLAPTLGSRDAANASLGEEARQCAAGAVLGGDPCVARLQPGNGGPRGTRGRALHRAVLEP